jgi:hypothetical protein
MTTSEMVALLRSAGAEGSLDFGDRMNAIADRLEALERVAEAAQGLRDAYGRASTGTIVWRRVPWATLDAIADALEPTE